MVEHDDLDAWLLRGNQRRAVAAALLAIRTGTQVWRTAATRSPRITLRDTRAILRDLEARYLARCLNPSARTGRLYAATEHGRVRLARLFPEAVHTCPGVPLDADLIGFVLRGRVRHAVFCALAAESPFRAPLDSATAIKRYLRDSHPVTLNQTIRALHELRRAGLIAHAELRGQTRTYSVTEEGRKIVRFLSHP
jgi:hypothetical protein